MPCIVNSNSIHQDNFYRFPAILRTSLSEYSHCSDYLPEAAQNNEITVFRCPLGAGRRRHSRRELFPLNLIAKNNGKKTIPQKAPSRCANDEKTEKNRTTA